MHTNHMKLETESVFPMVAGVSINLELPRS